MKLSTQEIHNHINDDQEENQQYQKRMRRQNKHVNALKNAVQSQSSSLPNGATQHKE